MKAFTAIFLGTLAVRTYAFPFEALKDSGLVTDEIAAKFEAVKRNPGEAERLFKEYQAQSAQGEKRSKGSGLLNLPLGGGLDLEGNLKSFTGALSGLELPTIQPQGLKAIPGNDPDHQFQKPKQGDVRGMCPTLNTLANHGYISRDGITSFAEAANAVQTGYGFTFSLSVFLSALGLLAGGDLPSGKYTIGGADDRVPNTLGPALGLDSHGVFEVDGSITRQDTYFGNTPLHNNANFLLERWNQYVAISKKHGGLFNIDANAEDNGYKYDTSKATNPEFFAGVIWFAVSHAARVFVYEALPNGTNPGVADYKNVAPFFLDERFPDNWFRRGDPFPLPGAFQQAGEMFLKNPRLIGQNSGVGNFEPAGIDLKLSSPADVGCFLIKNFFDLAPGQLSAAAYDNLDLYKAFVQGAMVPFFVNDGFFNCNVTEFNEPSQSSVGSTKGSASSSGSPVNGRYPGVGVIKPDQPSIGKP